MLEEVVCWPPNQCSWTLDQGGEHGLSTRLVFGFRFKGSIQSSFPSIGEERHFHVVPFVAGEGMT